MFKTRFISMLVLLMTAATGAWADELTVHDGTATNEYVPVYGVYADAYLKCEMVMPASELSAMNGSEISAMTFYSSETNMSWGSASFTVFLKEVSEATIGGFSGPGTVVYEGALSIVAGEMTVTFTTPYTYNGGNLLIGVYNTAIGDYLGCAWYGETVSGASVQGYDYNALADVMPTQRNFLPKTTFTYEAPEPTATATYTVTLKEGTEDATNWTITPAEATTTGVAAGTEVKASYGGVKKVKSVKAKKKAKPAATVTTAPSATADVTAGSTTALVSAGEAEGGTMMYKVTNENTQPASTEGFSATVPTAEDLAAGTYYVWYYVKADASHTDSEIAGPVTVTVKIAELSETITFSGGKMNYTYYGTHFSVNGNADIIGGFLMVNKWDNMTIAATDGKTITKVVFNYEYKANLSGLTFSSGNFDGDSTVNNVNATTLTVGSNSTSGTNFSGVTIYYSE